MDILIIGNGFDLAHDLKTSYKDFLQFCEKLPPDNEFRSNLWLRYFWDLTAKNKRLGETWIDFETEIYNQISKLRKISQGNYHLYVAHDANPDYRNNPNINAYFIDYSANPIYRMPTDALKTNEEKIKFIYKQLRNFTMVFENYLIEIINTELEEFNNLKYKLSLPGILPDNLMELKVISFNYTDTCEKLYNSNFKVEPIYIHGKASSNNDDCNLVLGTHSFDRKNNESDKQLLMELNVFQKHNQRHKYGTIEAYQDFLREITNPKNLIRPVFHVVGHSLDETDHNVLKHIFTANINSVINIYYHDETAQQKLIDNITDIIGEAEVMTKVRLIHQHDPVRGLLKPIKKRQMSSNF